jgi:hypothetical protein
MPELDATPALTKPSLFAIVEHGLELLAELDEAEGEVSDELGSALDVLAVDITGRAEAYAAVARMLEAEADACERFVETYDAKAKRKRANVAKLKARLKEALEQLGMRKAVGPTGGAAIQRNGTSALVITVPEHELEQRVPKELLRKRVEIDREELKRRLQAGETFDFAHLETGTHLRWR